jgi:hypothetical protein
MEFTSDQFSTVVTKLLGIFSGNDIVVDVGTAATAVGVTLTTLFFCMAIFSEITAFRVERFEEAIRLAMKFIVAKIIIENTSWISGAIYAIFVGLSQNGLVDGLASFTLENMNVQEPSPTGMEPLGTGLGWLVQVFTYTTPTILMSIFVYATMLLTVAGIVFEIGMHMAVAPIALSTLCNEMTRPTGISFIKSYAAVCIQAFMFGACLQLYAVISSAFDGAIIALEDQSNLFAGIIGSVMPVIMVLCLTTVLKRSSEVTKRMLGV